MDIRLYLPGNYDSTWSRPIQIGFRIAIVFVKFFLIKPVFLDNIQINGCVVAHDIYYFIYYQRDA